MPQTKTAKDLPVGAEVTGRNTVWVKDRPGHHECWTASTGGHLSDGTIDRLLAEGAFITRVPTSACPHRCRNCEGVDPQSCPFNPKEQ